MELTAIEIIFIPLNKKTYFYLLHSQSILDRSGTEIIIKHLGVLVCNIFRNCKMDDYEILLIKTLTIWQ